MRSKGFVFTLEAAMTLLIAIALVSSLKFMRISTFSDVYLFELANDFQQLAAKKYYPEFAAFSRGDFIAGKKIGDEYSKLIDGLGDYCLMIEARAQKLEINCGSREHGISRKFPTSRLFFDGEEFFELKMSLVV